ncbi:MAG: FAD-dependent oxidoreductase, partial [Proteobacteria bacterium]|nr:FAD-dependent oxidoreductase [Pseudomonadota bacterium]
MAGDDFDICVIGAGSGGLSVAYAASHMGQKVALIEGHRMGGDCLNFGCVPSKALIKSAKVAAMMRGA